MGEKTAIEWCDHTFNPWTGCAKVSPACDHCYAESWAKRSGSVVWGPDAERRRTTEANWKQPLKWNKEAGDKGVRHKVFCASLADVFDNAVPRHWRTDLFSLIRQTPNLDWLLLTKRIGNAQSMITRAIEELEPDSLCGIGQHNHSPVAQWPWPNVWIGATICNQEEAERDIPKLLKVPAAKRFLSIEPLLGKIDISRWLDPTGITCMDVCPDTPYVDKDSAEVFVATDGEVIPLCPHCGIKASWTGWDCGIDWVIVGGESGPGARPMHPKWALDLRDQCLSHHVPFLFKQWGEWAIDRVFSGGDLGGDMRRGIVEHVRFNRECDGRFLRGDVHMRRVGKKKAGRVLDGQTWDEVPS